MTLSSNGEHCIEIEGNSLIPWFNILSCLYRRFHLPISIQDLNKKQKYLDTYTVSQLLLMSAIFILFIVLTRRV